MQEESVVFETGKTFYNPQMQFCRSFFSLAIGAIGEPLDLLDAFSASGIRGIRYARENRNVANITFLDADRKAIALCRKNARKNKMKRAAFIANEFTKAIVGGDLKRVKRRINFLEIDPFGTPVPYLQTAMYALQLQKTSYLCISATDTAVLCGPETKACLKNYHAKSLNNEFTHENGTRILIKRVAEAAAEHNLGIVPLVSLSDRHYIKILLRMERGASKADECVRQLGYVSCCSRCGWRWQGKRMALACPGCKGVPDYAGPLWLGGLHDGKFIKKMQMLNIRRNYEHRKEIEKTLEAMRGDLDKPAYYYNIHEWAQRAKWKDVPGMETLLQILNKKGANASRTHFSTVSFKTGMEWGKLRKVLGVFKK